MSEQRLVTLHSLSRRERIILDMLRREGAPMWGRDIIAQSDGAISRGRVYVLLDRMEERGLVNTVRDDQPPMAPGVTRLMYRITPLGVRALSETARPWWKFWR